MAMQGVEQRTTRPTVLGRTEAGRILTDDHVEVSSDLKGWGYPDKKLRVGLSRRDPVEEATLMDGVDPESFTAGWGMETGLRDPEQIRKARMGADQARSRRSSLREFRLETHAKRKRASLRGIDLLVPIDVLAPTPDEVLSKSEREKARLASNLEKPHRKRPSIDERRDVDYHLLASGLVDDLFVYGEPMSKRAHTIAVERDIDKADEAEQRIPAFNEVFDAEEHARIQEGWTEADGYYAPFEDESLNAPNYAPDSEDGVPVFVLLGKVWDGLDGEIQNTPGVLSLEALAERELAEGEDQELPHIAFEAALTRQDHINS